MPSFFASLLAQTNSFLSNQRKKDSNSLTTKEWNKRDHPHKRLQQKLKIALMLLSASFVLSNELTSALKLSLKEEAHIEVYCRPNVYYRIPPDSAFLKRNAIKKTYFPPQYRLKIEEILKSNLSLQQIQYMKYKPVHALLMIFDGGEIFAELGIWLGDLQEEDRLLVDGKAYAFQEKGIAYAILQLFCSQKSYFKDFTKNKLDETKENL